MTDLAAHALGEGQYEYDRPFFTDDLGQSLSLSAAPELPEELDLRICDSLVLRGFGEIAARQLRVLDNPRSSRADIVQALESDIHASCLLLRAVRSVSTEYNRTVRDIREAIRILGPANLRRVVSRAALEPTFKQDNAVAGAIWRHAAAVGTLARLLAYRQQDCDPQTAFSAGLLHDVGSFVLYQSLPRRYSTLYARAVADQWNFEPLEEMAFGMNHAVLGAAVAIRWDLDHSLIAAIRLHHWIGKPGFSKCAPELRSLVATVALADDLVHDNMHLDGTVFPIAQAVDTPAARLLPSLQDELADIWPEFCRQFTEIKILLYPQQESKTESER